MLSAICRICAFEWVRALRGLALISSIDNRRSMRCLVTIAFPPAMWVDGTDLERVGGPIKTRTTLAQNDFARLLVGLFVNGIIPPSSKLINSGLVESVGRSRFRTGLSSRCSVRG
jgi:hypothetical protein